MYPLASEVYGELSQVAVHTAEQALGEAGCMMGAAFPPFQAAPWVRVPKEISDRALEKHLQPAGAVVREVVRRGST